MTPTLSGNNYRIVLTWGANPRDLDSHVVGTLSNGNSFHTYYSHKSQYDGNTEVCNLDVDDTSSYGPETITLNATTDNPYYYYIYRYGGSGTLSSSNAQVRVYQGGNLLGTFNVPTDQGNGDYWNVFAIVNGKFVVKDTITSDADINYASVSTNALPANFAAEDNAPKKKVSIDKNPRKVTATNRPIPQTLRQQNPKQMRLRQMYNLAQRILTMTKRKSPKIHPLPNSKAILL